NVQYYMKMNDINAMEQYDNWLLTYFKIKGMH
ncbi:molybdopterin-guanine dinucleotide biosynthesis protein B, partial [Listeria monocytogenes]